MKHNPIPRHAALTLAILLATMAAHADRSAEKGRVVFEKYKDAVVTVHMVLNTSFQGQDQEQDTWTNGVVLSAGGLTAIPLTSADPYASYARALPPEKRRDIETRVSRMEIVVQGERVAAESVIRDSDLDLLLLRPLEVPAKPWVHTGLDHIGVPGLLEETVVIMQLGEVARRAHTAMIARVEAVITKPRPYYHLGEDRSDGLIAAPAFTLDGAFIGLGVYRTVQGGGDNVAVIILPASEIAEVAAQVPEHVADAAKAETR